MLGLDRDVVDAAMEEIEDTEDVRCAKPWRRRFGEPPADRKERERQIRYLAYRGFRHGRHHEGDPRRGGDSRKKSLQFVKIVLSRKGLR